MINDLEVLVIRYSDGFYLEDQDMFNLSGIFRDVTLHCMPFDIQIYDFNWRALPIDTNTHMALINIDVSLKWDMDIIKRLVFDDSNFGSLSDHASSYITQLQKDWVVSCRYISFVIIYLYCNE